jgi:hypothetical protein
VCLLSVKNNHPLGKTKEIDQIKANQPRSQTELRHKKECNLEGHDI